MIKKYKKVWFVRDKWEFADEFCWAERIWLITRPQYKTYEEFFENWDGTDEELILEVLKCTLETYIVTGGFGLGEEGGFVIIKLND